MTTIGYNGDPVDLDAPYLPPWANPATIVGGRPLYQQRNRKCVPCDFTWRGSRTCELCGGEVA